MGGRGFSSEAKFRTITYSVSGLEAKRRIIFLVKREKGVGTRSLKGSKQEEC